MAEAPHLLRMRVDRYQGWFSDAELAECEAYAKSVRPLETIPKVYRPEHFPHGCKVRTGPVYDAPSFSSLRRLSFMLAVIEALNALEAQSVTIDYAVCVSYYAAIVVPAVAEMFPDIRFQAYHPDDVSERLAKTWRDILLVCDDVSIHDQIRWWRASGARAAVLTMCDGSEGEITIPVGEVLAPVFGPAESSARLWLASGNAGPPGDCVFDWRRFEGFMSELTFIVREWAEYDHDIAGYVPGLCRCYDCSRAVAIFLAWTNRRGPCALFSRQSLLVAYVMCRAFAAIEQSPHDDCGVRPIVRRSRMHSTMPLQAPKHAAKPKEKQSVKTTVKHTDKPVPVRDSGPHQAVPMTPMPSPLLVPVTPVKVTPVEVRLAPPLVHPPLVPVVLPTILPPADSFFRHKKATS